MDVKSVGSTTTTQAPASSASAAKKEAENKQTAQATEKPNEEAAVYEKSNQAVTKADVNKLLEDSKNQAESLKKMILKLIEKQMSKSEMAFQKDGPFKGDLLIEIDAETRAAAQEAISEDGYYGVKQTSERILGFAEAMAAGNPKVLAEMKKAVIQGFKEAEKAWGGELPSICGQTYDAVMKGFEELEKKLSGVSGETAI